jgi:large subunit ribosomal protein L4
MKVNIFNIDGSHSDELDLNVNHFSLSDKYNSYYLLDRYQNAMSRSGNQSTKNRSEVRGGGAKPYKQKGTGRARRGTQRTPLRPGGGVIFGPKPRTFNHKLNNIFIKKTIITAFFDKFDSLCVFDYSTGANLKTKSLYSFFNSHIVSFHEYKLVAVITDREVQLIKSLRNFKNIQIIHPKNLLIAPFLRSEKVFLSKSALNFIKEFYL